MIGQLHSVVIDAPDAHALAGFYAQLLGMDVKGAPATTGSSSPAPATASRSSRRPT